jgi:hypothetical protein
MSLIELDPDRIEARDLFPLPLVAMENFWLWDDVQPYPKRFRIVVSLRGQVDIDCLEKSIACAALRHPLLISHVDRSSRIPKWVIPVKPAIDWKWNQGDWSDSPFPQDWDLRVEGGLRIWGRQSSQEAELCLETHHACSDGLGIRQFLRDVFMAYDQLWMDRFQTPKLPPLAFQRIEERGRFRRPPVTMDARPTTTWEKIVGAYHFHFRGPTPVATHKLRSGQTTAASGHHYFRHTFQVSDTTKILNAFADAQTESRSDISDSSVQYSMLNDAAVATMIQVLASWNEQFGTSNPGQRLRILIPTDLRTLRDSRLPAANRLGFGFVVATHADCHDFSNLLSKVRSQTQAIRKYFLGLDFVEIFSSLANQPKLGAWLVRRPRCLATAVLTNLGDSFGRYRKLFKNVDDRMQVGNLLVEDFIGYPPLRIKTLFGVGMSRCAGRLTMGLIIDSTHFTREQAEQLKQHWIRAWSERID